MTDELMRKLEERQYRTYVLERRNARTNETYQDRDNRYLDVDRILRGEFRFKTPKGDVIQGPPMVTNLAVTFTQDVSRLVTEIEPGIRAPMLGDKRKDEVSAALREMSANTYWLRNRGELLVPQLATDLITCGAAYLVSTSDSKLDVPHITRYNPRTCYPTIHNGMLLDLLAIQVVPVDVAIQMFPGLGIAEMVKEAHGTESVEIHDYFSPELVYRSVVALGRDRTATNDPTQMVYVDAYEPAGNVLPVGYAQLSTHDGAQRGLLDQLVGSLEAKNKIAALLVKNLENMVFTPWFAQNIMNADDTPDEDTIYEALPDAERASFERVQAAQPNNTLYALLETLDVDQRALIGYPESRSGVVGQSIASGSFVDATQGMLSTTTKIIQEHITSMREQVHLSVVAQDREFLNREKTLAAAVADKTMYVPSELWSEGHDEVMISYGPNAGLSRGQADVRDLQFLGAGIVAKQTVREHVGEGYLKDRLEEQDRIELEEGEGALRQIFWADPEIPFIVKVETLKIMKKKGLDLPAAIEAGQEAVLKAESERRAAAAESEAGAAGVAEGAPGEIAPPAAPIEEAAPESGVPAAAPEFAPPPRSQFFVNLEGR
jgi:hypothetical protein